MTGTAAEKLQTCLDCGFYGRVRADEGDKFDDGARALGMLASGDTLAETYLSLSRLHQRLRKTKERLDESLAEEQVLREETLQGTVAAMAEALALVSPTAFARCSRARRLVSQSLEMLDAEDRWPVELAVVLAETALIGLPAETQRKLAKGQSLDATERSAVDEVPRTAARLIAKVPRLDPVRTIMEALADAPQSAPGDRPDEKSLGVELLRTVLAYDSLMPVGQTDPARAIAHLRKDHRYEPQMVDTIERVALKNMAVTQCSLGLDDLKEGFVLRQDLLARDGTLILRAGHVLKDATLIHLQRFARTRGVQEPIAVLAAGFARAS